ncbi:hypothetical protein ID866_3749 [Astraeus odoratus]|nr:hypothetical protein ID866_3749 [Astraeus odoratus]
MRCHFEGIQSDFVIVDTPSFFTFVDPDGDVIMQQWMDARYTKKCAAAAILYMHNIAANKDDPNLAMKNHLGTFRRICPPGALVPRTVHVVSIIDRAIQRPVPGDKIEAWMQPLRQQAREEGASVFEQQFEGRPETAWNALRDLLDACVKMAPS